MIFKEFGDRNQPVIILLHGGGLSWWSIKPQIMNLSSDYFVVAPIIDGHGENFRHTFVSIESAALEVIDYIDTHFNGSIFAIAGLSIGAQIAIEVLSKRSTIAKKAIIESALVYPLKTATRISVLLYHISFPLIQKRWFSRCQAKALSLPSEYYEDYFRDSSRMTKETLLQLTKSNGNFHISPSLKDSKAQALILVGEKELSIMRKSAKRLQNTIKNSQLLEIAYAKHGEFSLKTPHKYLDLLRDFLSTL